jgi:hypothetical protein
VVTPKSRMSLSHKLAAVSRALLDTKVSGLVGPLEPGRLRVLISTAETTRVREVIGSVARAIHDRSQLLTPPSTTVIGAGNPVKSIDELQRSFGEANGAAEAARTLPGDHLFVSTSDIGLRGLVQLFREEPRLRSYAERKLGPIIDYDERNDTVTRITETPQRRSRVGSFRNRRQPGRTDSSASPTLLSAGRSRRTRTPPGQHRCECQGDCAVLPRCRGRRMDLRSPSVTGPNPRHDCIRTQEAVYP